MTYSFSENQWGEKYLEEINRTDFVNIPSSAFFDKVLDFDVSVDNTLFIVIGSDSGLILSYLSKQKVGRGSKVAVIEHDDLYPLISKEYRGLLEVTADETDSFTHPLSLHKFSLWQQEVLDESFETWALGGQVRLVESNASATDYAHIYTEIHKSVNRVTAQKRYGLASSINFAIFTKNQFLNSIDSTLPLKRSNQFGREKTAVVLGGGPSLDSHIEWLKTNRSKLFIIAVSRISNKLILHDMKPDMVVSVDPYRNTYEVSKQALAWREIPLVYNYHVEPKLLQHWQGPTFYLGKRLPWHTQVEGKDCIPSAGPTVSHAAIVVAWQLGFSTILLSGVDFCYSSSAASHANDSPEQLFKQLPSLCNAKVETYSGRTAGTLVMFKSGLETLEKLGEVINRDVPILHNLALEAGLCPSIPWIDTSGLSLNSVKPEFSEHYDCDDFLAPLNEIDNLEKEFKYARLQLSKVKAHCNSARKYIKKIHGSDIVENAAKYSRKLTKIRKGLESDYTEYVDAIIFDNEKEFIRTKKPLDFEQMNPEELSEWGCHYYDLLIKGATTMIDHIDGLAPKIELRRDEHTDYGNVRSLMKRWREDDTPGRILVWNRVYGHLVPPKDRAWVQRTIGKFRATLNQTVNNFVEAPVPWKRDIGGVLKSLVYLRENRHQDELQIIAERMSDREWPYCALKPFTFALICELQENISMALQQFQKSLDVASSLLEDSPEYQIKMTRLLEECLVRMTSNYIKLNDHHSALNTLGTLCEFVPTYVLIYSKMLRTCNQHEAAIELLKTYVELYPYNKKAQYTLESFILERDQMLQQTNDPEYADKINSAMQAIIGSEPGKAA